MDDLIKEFERLCDECKLTIEEHKREQMVAYLEGIYAWNERLNLTTIEYGKDALVLHLIDSLLPLKSLKIDMASFVDIGTGGGFPGVPFGIVTEMPGVLIDSVSKKMSAVEDVLDQIGLTEQIETKSVRAEEMAKSHSSVFGYALARAVAPLEVIMEYATPLLTYDGLFISYKAVAANDEWKDAKYAASVLGLENVSRETYELPYDYGTREISIWKRVGEPRVKLPRKNGMPKKRPISKLSIARN